MSPEETPPPADMLRLDLADALPPEAGSTPAMRMAPRGGAAPAKAQSDEVDVLGYVRSLYKRRYVAIATFVVVMLGAVVYTYTAIPLYEARAQLLIDAESQRVVTFEEVISDQTSSGRANDYFQTQYRILESRALARRTIDTLGWWNHPLLGGNTRASGEEQSQGLFGSIAGPIARLFRAPAPAAAAPSETAAQSRVVDAFLRRLVVVPVRTSRLVDIRFRSTDPGFATKAANALARAYIQQDLEYKLTASKNATVFLDDQLTAQRRKVEAAEQALQQYRESNDAMSLDERQDIVVQSLGDLNTAANKAQANRIAKEELYNQLLAVQGDRASLETFPVIASNPLIQQMRAQLAEAERTRDQAAEKLGPNHPTMRAMRTAIQAAEERLQAEVSKVVQVARNDFLAAQNEERSVQAALGGQKASAQTLGRKGVEYSVLQREAESSRQIFDTLLERARETDISSDLRTSNIRIVDEAEVPRDPISPNRRANLLLALFGGTGLGLGLAALVAFLDDRISTPDDVETHLGLPMLGWLPAVGTSKDRRAMLIHSSASQEFVEAFRTIRTNVLFSSAEPGGKAVVITSTSPHEGKTTVSCNLAISFAQTGQRVLLVDADMRRGTVHETFEIAQEPGLSNLLVGASVKTSEAIVKTDVPGLWILPAGRVPPNPAELLGSARFRQLVKSLGEYFDWVVLDTPPVAAVTDPSVVAHSASGVVFVIGADMTSRKAAQIALSNLTKAGSAPAFGAILNKLDVKGHRYYYGAYYRSDYRKYYTRQGA